MAYDERLAERVRSVLGARAVEKKMFGGLVYVAPDGLREHKALTGWVGRAVGFAATLPAKPKKPALRGTRRR